LYNSVYACVMLVDNRVIARTFVSEGGKVKAAEKITQLKAS